MDLRLLLVLAVICVVTVKAQSTTPRPPPEKFRTRFILPKNAIGKYGKSRQLSAIFGGDVKLAIRHNRDVTVNNVDYKLYVGDTCKPDGANLFKQGTVDVPAGKFNFTLNITTDNFELPCGPGCLFVNVSNGDMWGAARAPLMYRCDTTGVDLKLTSSVDTNKVYRMEIGKSVVELITALTDLKVENAGTRDTANRSTDLAQSVLLYVREHRITQQDVIEVATTPCSKNDLKMKSDGDGGDSGPQMTKRAKRAVADDDKKEEEEEDAEGDAIAITDILDEHLSKRDELKVKVEKIPRCFTAGYGFDDIPLAGGDVLLKRPIKSGGEQPVDLTKVKFVGVKGLCDKMDPNIKVHNVELFLVVDPLRMNNDSDWCNNAIRLNVTFSCENVKVTDYDKARCEVNVNPLSRGHEATVQFNGETVLEYNGKGMQYADDFYNGGCKDIDGYLKQLEDKRYALLGDRFKRAAKMDGGADMCKDVDESEKQNERELFEKDEEDEEEKTRMKRATTDDMKMRLKESLERLAMSLNKTGLDAKMAQQLFCEFQQIEKKVGELDANNELVKLAGNVKTKLGPLVTDHKLTADKCSKTVNDLEDLVLNSAGSRADRLRDVVKRVQEENDEKERAKNGNFTERFNFLMKDLERDNSSCPGMRNRASGDDTDEDKIASLVEKASDEDTKLAPVPEGDCGDRKLEEVFSKGGAFFISREVEDFKVQFSADDYDFERMKLVKTIQEVTANMNDTIDTEDVKLEVERKMNKSADDERERCGDGENAAESRNLVKDTYKIYWGVKDGKVWQGVPDILNEKFGEDDGEERKLRWKVMATCFCSNCQDREMAEPEDRKKWFEDFNKDEDKRQDGDNKDKDNKDEDKKQDGDKGMSSSSPDDGRTSPPGNMKTTKK